MSRVGKKPIPIPDKTTVEIDGARVTARGPKGELSMVIPGEITASVQDSEVIVERPSEVKRIRAMHGLVRALINNMVVGVTEGFERELQVLGVGYRMEMRGNTLVMYLGYSHPVVMNPPEGITIEVFPKENRLKVSGIDKQLVGQTAAKIRSFREPEPYKGKGVRYLGEYVRTKAGKTAG